MTLPTTSNVTRPRAFGFHGRLDDLLLRFSITPERPLDIVTAPLQAPAVNTGQNAEDFRNEYGERFSRVDFTGGEGLDFAHKRNLTDLDATRFWASEHIDVTNAAPGEPSKFTLLPPTANIETSADTNLHLVYDGTSLIMGEGTAYRKSTDWTAATPTFSALDPHNGDAATTALGATTLGTDVYFALGVNGIHKRTAAGVVSSVSTENTKRVWGVKRQLLASRGTTLDSVNLATGAHTILVTLPTGQEWLDVYDAGHAILACASDGSIYALGYNSSGASGGTLELKAQSVIGGGEIPYVVCWDGTFVHYATREVTPSGAIGRWYRAQLDRDSFTLAGAQLLKQWGDQSATIDHCPRRIVATRDAVFIGAYETGGSFLWRYDRVSAGITRHLDLGASGLVVDIVAVSGRLFATVSGHGLRREKVGSFEAEGYLIGPLADFFTSSAKSWAGAIIEHDALADGCRIELYYTTDPTALSDPDSTAWVRVKNVMSGQDTTTSTLNGVESRYLAGMVKLYTTVDTSAPAVRSFAFHAYQGEGDVEVTFYAVVNDIIGRPGFRRQRVRGNGDAVYNELKGKEGGYAELEIFHPAEILRGVVEQVGTRIPALTRSGSAGDVSAIKFRGKRVSFAGQSDSDAVFGTGMFGEMIFGGAEAEEVAA